MANRSFFQHGRCKGMEFHDYIYLKFQISLQFKKRVHQTLLTTLAKSLAGNIPSNGNQPIQRPVASQSCLVSEETNKRKRCYQCPSKKTAYQKYNATNMPTEHLQLTQRQCMDSM